MRLLRQTISVGAAIGALACGGGGAGSTGPGTNTGGNNPPPTGGGNTALDNITLGFTQATMTAGQIRTMNVIARDTQGAVIAGATANFASDDQSIAEVSSSGDVMAVHAGSTQIAVSVTVGNVTKTGNAAITVNGTLPNGASVTAGADATFQPGTVVIAQGGSVTWSFGPVSHTVTFTAAASGTPASIFESYNANANRTFTTKGNFPYVCSIHAGMSGEVIVR